MNILVVDDNEADQFLSEYAIQQYDEKFIVDKAYDGKEALHFLEQCNESPEFVFLDINMPGMNGFDFLEHYHLTDHDHAPIIVMLSSSIRSDDKQKCMAYPNVKKVIAKPLNLEAISNCMELATRH